MWKLGTRVYQLQKGSAVAWALLMARWKISVQQAYFFIRGLYKSRNQGKHDPVPMPKSAVPCSRCCAAAPASYDEQQEDCL